MDSEEQLRSAMLLLTYVLLKRRRDVRAADSHRHSEVQRRIRQRHYFLQRQRRMLMMMMAGGLRSSIRLRTRPWSTIPRTDWWERVVMTEFQSSDWLNKFRMSRETFFHLCEKLRPRLARQNTSFRQALPVEKRVAVALWRLASNVEYRTISSLFGVGKSTVCKCVRDLCHAVVALLSQEYMRCPTEQELEESAQLFLSHTGFPHCVAAVGTLHTAILTPSHNASDYANSADWLSVITQVAVSGRGQFWDVCASFPGGTDPAEILQNSSLWASAEEGGFSPAQPRTFMGTPLRYMLVGQPCYPLRPWLLTAFTERKKSRSRTSSLTPPQRAFNLCLERALGVCEGALLRLRARWQCLSKRNDCGLDVVPTMVLACCVLHNVCEEHRDPFRPEWEQEVAEENPQPRPLCLNMRPCTAAEEDGEAGETRRLFCDYFEQQEQ